MNFQLSNKIALSEILLLLKILVSHQQATPIHENTQTMNFKHAHIQRDSHFFVLLMHFKSNFADRGIRQLTFLIFVHCPS